MSKPKDYYNSAPDSRTFKELHELYSLSSSHETYACVRKPLNIPLDHVILDELHLMLRVTDRLMENLMSEVMERDSKEDINKESGEDKNVYLEKFVRAISELAVNLFLQEKTRMIEEDCG